MADSTDRLVPPSAPLSLDMVRDDLAEAMGIAPSSMSLEDDLIGLGLDSIRAMRLVGRWRRRGASIRFADFATCTTLAQWWAVIDAARPDDPPAPSAGVPRSVGGLSDGAGGEPGEGGLRPVEGPPVDESAPFPLTPMQHAYWVGRSDDQVLGGVGCHAYLEFDTEERIDPARLEAAGRALVARHGMLRARFLEDGTQRIAEDDAWPGVRVHAVQGRHELLELRERLSHRRLDVSRGELFDIQLSQLPDGPSRVHIEVDFLAADVIGLRILLDDLAVLYLNPDRPPEPLTYSFARYRAEHEERQRVERERDRQWWRARLAELPGAPQLPFAIDPTRIERPRFRRRQAWLDRAAWDAIVATARALSLTPAMALAAVYAEVLGRWSGHQRFMINLPVFARDESVHPDVARLVADFTDLMLLPVDTTDSVPFVERARALQREFRDAAGHIAYSGVDVLRDLTRSGQAASGSVVFACNLGNELITGNVRRAFGRPGFMITQTPQVWLDHQINEYPEGLHLAFDAVEELFPQGVLDAMFDSYLDLLTRLPSLDWTQPVTIDLPPDQRAVRERVNATGDGVRGGLVHGEFFRRVRSEPQRTALICGDAEVSYGELAERALTVAGALRSAGIVNGDAVAVTMPRGTDRVIAVLGILAAGAVYVPIGIDQPRRRRALILERAGVVLTVVADSSPLLEAEPALELGRALLARPLPEPVPQEGDSPAYVIFTSGSTGEPKGVEVAHEAAWNTIDDVATRWRVGADDRVLAVSALEFDLSVFDVFGMLGRGGALVLVEEHERRDARSWLRLCERHSVTLWNSVPVLLEMLLAARPDRLLPRSLRLAVVSGDWAAADLPARLDEASAGGCELYVLGGATEASIWSNIFPGRLVDPEWTSIPYGLPLRGQRYRVVDEVGRDCPDWVSGELWIGGAGVAVGYRGDPAQTKSRFVTTDSGRWYCTGDIGRYWPDGTLEFLGRVDTQVKVRGHRIEMGEIETAMETLPQVRAAVVVAPGERTSRRLVGFVTPASVDLDRLTEHIRRRLPSHALPALLLAVDDLPLTGNGKIDRAALTERASSRFAREGSSPSSPPRGPVESEVAALWAKLLSAPSVSRGDDFFALGGDSLIATRLVADLRRLGYGGATLSSLFRRPVLADFAAVLTTDEGTGAGRPIVVADPERRYDPFPPTEVQRAYLIGRSDRFALGGVGCHLYTELDGDIDLGRLTEAWNLLIARHDALRTVFDDSGAQRALPTVPRFEIRLVQDAAQLREQMSAQVLDPTRWPVFDVRACRMDSGIRVGMSIDNILLDALSVMILRAELDALYAAPAAALPPVDLTFRDYLSAMRPSEAQLDDARRYWEARLPTLPRAPRLPLAADPDEVDKPVFVRRQEALDEDEWGRLQAFARGHGLTPSVALASAYAETLAAWSGRPELTLTLTLFDRRDIHPHVNRVLGDFTSLLLAAHRGGEDRLSAARALQTDVAEALDHSEVSAAWVLREVARRASGTALSMPVVFTSMLGVAGPEPMAPPFGTESWGLSQTPQVWIDCQVGEDDGRLALRWDAVEQLFAPEVLDAMFAMFVRLVRARADGDWSAPLEAVRSADQGLPGPTALKGADGTGDAGDAGDRAVTDVPGPPRAGHETVVAALWADLLGVRVLDRTANFFALGGDSLTATSLVDRVERVLGAELSLRAFFSCPTVAGCAAAITATGAAHPLADVEEGEL